jgi:ring-1,2-phenylacetyl-CoA epoxidase subunit PaaE
MQLIAWLPGRLRVGAQAVMRQVESVKGVVTSPKKPVFASRHSEAQLVALTEQARQAKLARLEGAQGTSQVGLRAAFRDLEVIDARCTTPDALTLWLRNDPKDPISFRPGQFLTVVVQVGEGAQATEARRAYSLCSDPEEARVEGRLAVTIKRVKGGLVSERLFEMFAGFDPAKGARLHTLGPSGEFGLTPDPSCARHVVLIGAGSGITPLWSVAQAVLRAEEGSRVTLVYGSRSPAQTIFGEEIEALAARSGGRLEVILSYSQPPQGWEGVVGRLDEARLAALVPIDPQAAYLICGPAEVEQAAQRVLERAQIMGAQVERFVAQRSAQRPSESKDVWAVRFARSGRLLLVPAHQTLLEAGRAAGVPMPFSCTMGGCGACRVTKLEGAIEDEQPNCLNQAERAAGGCLTCISRPRSAVVLDL